MALNYPLKNLISVLFCLLVGARTEAFAGPEAAPRLSERDVLQRCYTQLTGQRLSLQSSLWQELSQKKATAICLDLLEQVKLTSDGALQDAAHPVHRQIMKQFLSFHRTWFGLQWAFQNTFPDNVFGAVDIYDPLEPALYLTRNLFSSENYTTVLTGSQTAVALRDPAGLRAALGADTFLRPTRFIYNGTNGPPLDTATIQYATAGDPAGNNLQSLPVPLVAMGQIYGIRMVSYQAGPLLPVIWTDPLSTAVSTTSPGLSVPQALLRNHGGGALGSPPYIMINLGNGTEYRADGAAKLPRRYIATVFKDFLCREGPLVRTSDVRPWLAAPAANVPSFRNAEACLRCHVPLDQPAMVLRNFRLASSANISTASNVRIVPVLAQYNADTAAPAEAWPARPFQNFHRTAPSGRLYFRSIEGKLIDVPLNGLESLGQSLRATPDYFACAAARYYQYFTNYRVELFDPNDPAYSSLLASQSDDDRRRREFVLALGKELQSGQGNLKKLVTRILESDDYLRGNFGH